MALTPDQKRIAELEATVARLEAQTQARVQYKISEAGYVEIFGIPGKGRFSNSNTPEGWDKLFALETPIKEFCKANAELIKARLEAYRANGKSANKAKAVG